MNRATESTQMVLHRAGIKTTFFIEKTLGCGGSCIAYEVSYAESDIIRHTGVLKEYCPVYLANYGKIRDEDGSLIIPKKISAQFSEGLQRFKDTYKSINEYLVKNPAATNYHPVQLGIYEGNNTLYTLVSCDYGADYNKTKDKDLKSLLNIILSVTKGVEQYHNAGFLHLDIKPENIFILNEVTELVKLFDFDTLTPIESIKAKDVRGIPCPSVYYVPELNQRNIRSIGIPTDIFEIGAMFFLRLFGCPPEPKDMTHDAVYNLDKADLLKGVSPKVRFEVEQILHRTLQVSPRRRYQTTAELKRQLEKLIELVDSKKPYLLNMPKWQPAAQYVGRSEEVAEIHKRLRMDGYVFVQGIGGLGKSELAKIYAKEYADYYHTVVFCKFTDSLAGLVATLPIQGITADNYCDFDRLVADKNQVLHDCDEHTLIIVDNFNVTYDKFIRDFLPAGNNGFKVIFTTRCAQAAEYYEEKTYHLPKLSLENCESLFAFRANSSFNLSEKETLQQIITTIDRNTLILVLLASAVKRTQMTLAEVLNKLVNQELNTIHPDLFHEYDYDTEETEAYNKLLSHLYAVFSISALTPNEVEVLKDMTLISLDGINKADFIRFCKSSAANEKVIESLVAQSWLFDNNELISMHPTVSDLIANNQNIKKKQSYTNLIGALEDYCNPDYVSHISVVLNRLSTAVQLERRYREEALDKRILIKAKLGRLYANIYRPAEAKEYLKESEKLAAHTKYEYYLPYIYSFLGKVEKDFGTITAAIEYYNKSVEFGKKITIRYYEIATESMMAIGECLFENKQTRNAFEQYKETLRFVRFHRFTNKIADIALALIEICQELNLSKDEKKYKALYDRYKLNEGKSDADSVLLNRINEAIEVTDIKEVFRASQDYLEKKRIELGEDSPLYKDLSQGQWLKYLFAGDKDTAIRTATEELSFVTETYGKDSTEMAKHLILIASVFPAMSEFEYAEAAAKKAIHICELQREEKSYTHFRAKLSLAQCYIPQNRISEAEAAISGIDLKSFQGNEVLSDIISSAGIVYCELSKTDEIEPLCIEFLKHKNTDVFGRFFANIVMSNVTERRGELDAAEKYNEQAKAILDNIPDKDVVKHYLIYHYRERAKISDRKGNYHEAISALQELLLFYTPDQKLYYAFFVIFVELGLYYVHSGDLNSAEAMYAKAEEILNHNHMAKEAYIGLYNNIAHQMMVDSKFKEAKKYLDKIVEIKPDIFNPETFLDAVICNNIAWDSFNMSEVDYAIPLCKKSLECFQKIGSVKTKEYVTTAYNLSLMYGEKKQFKDAVRHLEVAIEIIDKNPKVCDQQTRIWVDKYYVFALLQTGQEKEAYEFARQEVLRFSENYGTDDKRYVDLLIEIGLAFISVHNRECIEFYLIAQKRLEECNSQKTLLYARLMDYIGVYTIDLKDDPDEALLYFEKSKALFEELGAERDEMYPTVLQNITYADGIKKKKIDDAIEELARYILNSDNNE